MTIRLGKLSDLNDIMVLATLNFQESRFAHIPYNEEKVRKKVIHAIENKESSYFGAVACNNNDEIIGYLLGNIQEYMFCDETMAVTLFFYIRQDYRGSFAAIKLLVAFRTWAINRKAKEIYIAIGSEFTNNINSLLKKMGFGVVGITYSTWLK